MLDLIRPHQQLLLPQLTADNYYQICYDATVTHMANGKMTTKKTTRPLKSAAPSCMVIIATTKARAWKAIQDIRSSPTAASLLAWPEDRDQAADPKAIRVVWVSPEREPDFVEFLIKGTDSRQIPSSPDETKEYIQVALMRPGRDEFAAFEGPVAGVAGWLEGHTTGDTWMRRGKSLGGMPWPEGGAGGKPRRSTPSAALFRMLGLVGSNDDDGVNGSLLSVAIMSLAMMVLIPALLL